MSLSPGARIGGYEITGAIGAGGMGQVYRAHDRRLGRDVAIKILPDIFLADADRVQRFEREARTLAALNHPFDVLGLGPDGRFLVAIETPGQVRDVRVATNWFEELKKPTSAR